VGAVADLAGAGVRDWVVGKRQYSHHEGFLDPDGGNAPAVLYVYYTRRDPKAPGGARMTAGHDGDRRIGRHLRGAGKFARECRGPADDHERRADFGFSGAHGRTGIEQSIESRIAFIARRKLHDDASGLTGRNGCAYRDIGGTCSRRSHGQRAHQERRGERPPSATGQLHANFPVESRRTTHFKYVKRLSNWCRLSPSSLPQAQRRAYLTGLRFRRESRGRLVNA